MNIRYGFNRFFTLQQSNLTVIYSCHFSLFSVPDSKMARFRSFGSMRLYAVVGAFLALVGVAVFFAGAPSSSDAFGPWMSDGPGRSDEGGRQPDTYCPDRPWLTNNPNAIDDDSERNCYFRRNWACRTQETNDEPAGELCMWADCTACEGCNHLDDESDHHWDDCCYEEDCNCDADGNCDTCCVGDYCIWSSHRHGDPELDYCAPCLDWRWRVEGRPAYSTYRDQLGRLMAFDEYIQAAVETTHSNEWKSRVPGVYDEGGQANVEAINVSLFFAGVPHYDGPPVREHNRQPDGISPYYFAPSMLPNLTTAGGDSVRDDMWNIQGGEAVLPMHSQMLADARYPAGTYDFYAVDPRDRPFSHYVLGDTELATYPGVTPSPRSGGSYGHLLGPALHTEALYDPATNYRMGHISPSTVYRFDPLCPLIDPSHAHPNPSQSCPDPELWRIEVDGSDLRNMITDILSGRVSITEAELLTALVGRLGLGWLEDRPEIGRLRTEIVRPGFETLPDSAFSRVPSSPNLQPRPAGTPAWIYSWPRATPGPTPRYAGSVDDGSSDDNTRVDAGARHLVTGLRVLTAGGELCHEYTKSLVLAWDYLDGALFYDVEVWNHDTRAMVATERSFTTRAHVEYLELSPCPNVGGSPVRYELVVRAYDYTGQTRHPNGKHRSMNVSQYDTNRPPGPVSTAGNISFTMPTAPVDGPCPPENPCFCPPPVGVI